MTDLKQDRKAMKSKRENLNWSANPDWGNVSKVLLCQNSIQNLCKMYSNLPNDFSYELTRSWIFVQYNGQTPFWI